LNCHLGIIIEYFCSILVRQFRVSPSTNIKNVHCIGQLQSQSKLPEKIDSIITCHKTLVRVAQLLRDFLENPRFSNDKNCIKVLTWKLTYKKTLSRKKKLFNFNFFIFKGFLIKKFSMPLKLFILKTLTFSSFSSNWINCLASFSSFWKNNWLTRISSAEQVAISLNTVSIAITFSFNSIYLYYWVGLFIDYVSNLNCILLVLFIVRSFCNSIILICRCTDLFVLMSGIEKFIPMVFFIAHKKYSENLYW
jgi:hypothetical protein